MPAHTMFMRMQEAKMDGDDWLTHDLIDAIVAGEVAYDARLQVFYSPAGQYLYEDFSQRGLAKLVRDGRIVVEGKTVRLKGAEDA